VETVHTVMEVEVNASIVTEVAEVATEVVTEVVTEETAVHLSDAIKKFNNTY